jgi:hypothetical protein
VGLGATTPTRRQVLHTLAPERTFDIENAKDFTLLFDKVSNSIEKNREDHTISQTGFIQDRRAP